MGEGGFFAGDRAGETSDPGKRQRGPANDSMGTRIHVCEPGWEGALRDELQETFPESRHVILAPGWTASELSAADDTREATVALAGQCLSDAWEAEYPSISLWGRQGAEWIIENLRQYDGKWRLHVFGVWEAREAPTAGRCALIEQAILETLRRKQKRLLPLLESSDQAPKRDIPLAIVQIGLRTASVGYLSCALPMRVSQLRRSLSPFAGGVVTIENDRSAPSRAFAKLAEAEVRLGRTIQPGERCVDLGSSPGSWAWWGVRRGASVIAVDRSPLRDDLMRSPAVTFVRGDAFAFEPEGVVDWLLCDVVAFPERVFELLSTWLTRRRCRRFCVTIKFRGAEDYGWLARFKELLQASGGDFFLRRLTNNKNEVTAAGVVTDA